MFDWLFYRKAICYTDGIHYHKIKRNWFRNVERMLNF